MVDDLPDLIGRLSAGALLALLLGWLTVWSLLIGWLQPGPSF